MVEGGSRLGFAAKTHQSLRILGHFVRKEFQSNEAVEFRVLGLVNDAHAATADLLDDAVMRDDLIDHGLARGASNLKDDGEASQRRIVGVPTSHSFERGMKNLPLKGRATWREKQHLADAHRTEEDTGQ